MKDMYVSLPLRKETNNVVDEDGGWISFSITDQETTDTSTRSSHM